MKLHFGLHRDQPQSLIGELPLTPALFASGCVFFWAEDLLSGASILSILPWFFAFLFSGFFIPRHYPIAPIVQISLWLEPATDWAKYTAVQ